MQKTILVHGQHPRLEGFDIVRAYFNPPDETGRGIVKGQARIDPATTNFTLSFNIGPRVADSFVYFEYRRTRELDERHSIISVLDRHRIPKMAYDEGRWNVRPFTELQASMVDETSINRHFGELKEPAITCMLVLAALQRHKKESTIRDIIAVQTHSSADAENTFVVTLRETRFLLFTSETRKSWDGSLIRTIIDILAALDLVELAEWNGEPELRPIVLAPEINAWLRSHAGQERITALVDDALNSFNRAN
ncbi:MAG TPA: hypothetical protein VLK33_21420, partial [Terriglobales bacterium]|nr:hypothetical protein [Terriglobales bacterium]